MVIENKKKQVYFVNSVLFVVNQSVLLLEIVFSPENEQNTIFVFCLLKLKANSVSIEEKEIMKR